MRVANSVLNLKRKEIKWKSIPCQHDYMTFLNNEIFSDKEQY